MQNIFLKILRTATLFAVLQVVMQTGESTAQQSVRRPTELEKDFTEFRLAIDAMKEIEITMDKRLRVIEDDLNAVEKEIASLPKGSKKRAVAAERWEALVSDALHVRVGGLAQLRSYRDKAIVLGERIIRKDPSNHHVLAGIEKQVEEIKSSIVKTESEVERLAVILAYASGADDDKRELIRELEFNEDVKLPLQKKQSEWLASWRKQFETSPAAITGHKGKLRSMLTALKNRFVEIDFEIDRIRLVAEARKHFVEARMEWRKLVEALTAFNQYAQNINAAMPSTSGIIERINTRLMSDISEDQLPPPVEVVNIESSLGTPPTSEKPKDFRERIDRLLNKNQNKRRNHVQ